MGRLLLDPAPVDGGGAPALDPAGLEATLTAILTKMGIAPKPAEAPKPEPAKPDDLAADFERIRKAELEELRSVKTEFDRVRAEAKQKEQEQLLKAGQFEQVIKEYKDSLAQRENQLADTARKFKTSLRDREVAAALAGHQLRPGVADQIMRLISDQFETHDADGTFRVLARDMSSVKDAVARILKTSEYEHFLLPASQGGSGAQGGDRAGQTAPVKKSAEDMVFEQWAADQERARAAGMAGQYLKGKIA